MHDQLIANQSHEPRGAIETRKLKNAHQTNARTYVTENKSQDLKNKSKHRCLCCSKGIDKLWNYADFKMINKKQRYDVVKNQKLCFGCLGVANSMKDCKVSPFGINGCDRKHNRLLHENRSERRPIHQDLTNSYSVPFSCGLQPMIRVQIN